MNGFSRGPVSHMNGSPSERRAKTRFPLKLAMHYRTLNAEEPSGNGDTVDISSMGLRFKGDQQFPIGIKLEVTMRWPVPLEGSIPLQLRLVGTTVRTAGHETALLIDQHEFRTARR